VPWDGTVPEPQHTFQACSARTAWMRTATVMCWSRSHKQHICMGLMIGLVGRKVWLPHRVVAEQVQDGRLVLAPQRLPRRR